MSSIKLKAINKTQQIISQAEFTTKQRKKMGEQIINDKRDKSDLIIFTQELLELLSQTVLEYEEREAEMMNKIGKLQTQAK